MHILWRIIYNIESFLLGNRNKLVIRDCSCSVKSADLSLIGGGSWLYKYFTGSIERRITKHANTKVHYIYIILCWISSLSLISNIYPVLFCNIADIIVLLHFQNDTIKPSHTRLMYISLTLMLQITKSVSKWWIIQIAKIK